MSNVDHLDPALRHCGSCRFHDVAGVYAKFPSEAEGGGNIGYCRFGPPTLINVWDGTETELTGFDYAFGGVYWRITQEKEWCGQWQEDHRSKFERFGMEEVYAR
jgi:hypothetical protein